ncbi:MAG: two-component system sensor histidine kinase NtrB [Fibrobacterota bacterium]
MEINTILLIFLSFAVLILGGKLFSISLEKKRHEKRIKSLARLKEFNEQFMSSINSGVIVTDIENTITIANKTTHRIFRVPTGSMTGKSIFDFQFLEKLSDILAKTVDTIPPFYHPVSQEELLFSPDRETQLSLSVNATPLLDSSDRLNGYILVFQDMTEIKSLREIAERDKRLASLGEMAAGVAHEIRNPLSSIMGFISVMDEEVEHDHPHKRMFGIIMEEIERVSGVIQKILDFSRQVKPIYQESDLTDLIRSILIFMEREISESGTSINMNIPDSAKAYFDPEQIRQVLTNIIENAIHSMEGMKNKELKIELSNLEKHNNEYCIFSITDKGAGMDQKTMSKIFEPFYTKKGNKGTGLGLSICSRIMNDHKGFIEVISKEEKGSTFNVYIPRA